MKIVTVDFAVAQHEKTKEITIKRFSFVERKVNQINYKNNLFLCDDFYDCHFNTLNSKMIYSDLRSYNEIIYHAGHFCFVQTNENETSLKEKIKKEIRRIKK